MSFFSEMLLSPTFEAIEEGDTAAAVLASV
jgi:hypothetical protein